MARLRVKEIFRSIQGESTWAGWPCAFVRTVGCELRCVYCDEPHAFSGGENLEVDEVVERVAALGVPLVELTGGEPLQQRALPELVTRLCDAGYQVLIESGGHRDISGLDPRARVILDVKTPASGMVAHNDWQNLARLRSGDELKLVLCNRADYEWARALIRARDLGARNPVNLSPVHGALYPQDLVAWVLEDGLPVRVNLQLHKYIWGPDASGV
jgi:7-carboxy-7-deazaguanine synthase